MCVVSMVHDFYQPRIPAPENLPWTGFTQPVITPSLATEIADLRKLITEFREAVEAAKKVDVLTAQPDCVDPEKAKLEARVAELERRLDAITAVTGT